MSVGMPLNAHPLTAAELLQERLRRAEAGHHRRTLPPPASSASADFSSNDYLGLARDQLLNQLMMPAGRPGSLAFGSTGSRLLSGNAEATERLEVEVASWHGAAAALLFNSGYDANVGFFSALPRDSCQIFYDDRVHASVKDGIALSRASAQPFRHNDLEHLERRLRSAQKTPFVAVEAVYSMDGDFAPLLELVPLCERYGANVIVDEAHAAGVYGERGEGLAFAMGLQDRVFARVVTYGKAFGCHGAAVLGSALLREYLFNFAHAFVYTTALPAANVAAIHAAYQAMAVTARRSQLHEVVRFFRSELARRRLEAAFLPSTSPVQGVLMPVPALLPAAGALKDAGYDVKAIRSPTVRRGSERLRLTLHAFNTQDEMQGLLEQVAAWL